LNHTLYPYCRLKLEFVSCAESESWLASELVALELSVGLASRRPQTDGVPPIVALPDGSPDADRRVDAVVIGVEAVVHGLPADGYQRADIGGAKMTAVIGIVKSRRQIQRRVGPTEADILR